MIRVLTSVILAVLAGCTTQTVELEPEFDLRRAQARSVNLFDEASLGTCLVFHDKRAEFTSHYKTIQQEDTLNWMQHAVEVVFQGDVHLLQGLPAVEHNLPALSLHKAYVKHLATAISGVVVLSFEPR